MWTHRPTTGLKVTESHDVQPPPVPAQNYGFKAQNSPARLTRQERGDGTKPALWFGTPETRWPFLRSSSGLKSQGFFNFFFFFAPLSGCDSSLGGISSQRAAPDELLLIYSMCGQAFWGIRAPCSCSRIRVSPHMELIKKELRVEASPHQAPAPNEGTQPTTARPRHLPRPPPWGLGDAERRGG